MMDYQYTSYFIYTRCKSSDEYEKIRYIFHNRFRYLTQYYDKYDLRMRCSLCSRPKLRKCPVMDYPTKRQWCIKHWKKLKEQVHKEVIQEIFNKEQIALHEKESK